VKSAFSLQNDKKEREDNPLQPYKIVSLWDVLDFYAEKFANISRLMAELCMAPVDDTFRRIEFSQPILDQLAWLRDMAKELKIKGVAVSVDRLLRDLRSKSTQNTQIRRDALELGQRIIDDFEGELILAIPLKSADFYRNKEQIFSNEVIQQLQRIEDDAREARKLFALARYTACAFHLMRITEHVVHDFADKLSVPFDANIETMGDILANIQKKVNEWDRGVRPSAKKRKYGACCASMRGLVGRRNDIMHIREHYSEERAADLMGAVKACVEDYLKLPPP
jgi:hypothetical protein